MAATLDFPNTPADGSIHTDGLGQRWQYDARVNSWTVLGGPVGFTGTVAVGSQTLHFSAGILSSVA